MTTKEARHWLEQWQIAEHCAEYDRACHIAKKLLLEAGLDLENNWEEILREQELIQ